MGVGNIITFSDSRGEGYVQFEIVDGGLAIESFLDVGADGECLFDDNGNPAKYVLDPHEIRALRAWLTAV